MVAQLKMQEIFFETLSNFYPKYVLTNGLGRITVDVKFARIIRIISIYC